MDYIKLVEELAAPYLTEKGPGFSILGARGGKVFLKHAMGLADVEKGDAIRPDDNFMIASNTKQITCLAILMLREQGLLQLDETVERFFPDFPDYVKTVTIRQLMCHTSGVHEYFEDIDAQTAEQYRNCLTADMLQKIIAFGNLDFEPDTSWNYSNSAYVMLGDIIRQLSGMPFGKFVESRILAPLGMTRTFAPDDAEHRDRWQVEGYILKEDGTIEKTAYDMFSVGYADGNISSNTEDLLKWKNYLHSDSNLLVPAAVRREMFQAQILKDGTDTGYGFGLFTGSREEHKTVFPEGEKVIWHTGGTEGFVSFAAVFPEKELTLIMLCNLNGLKMREIFLPLAEKLLKEGE